MHICLSEMDTSDEWREILVLCLRITDQDTDTHTAYDMEYMTLAALYRPIKAEVCCSRTAIL